MTESNRDFKQEARAFVETPATAEDRQKWKGWSDENEAFFNVMLRELGAEGFKIQEVVSLDEGMLKYLPKPIYGLIFLFQFREDDAHRQEPVCPAHLWFANQTTSNACASVALLNVIMNIPGVDLGPILEQLRDFSMSLTPVHRGYAVGHHDYIRQIHNSFTRKMDWLNADLLLSNEMDSRDSASKKKHRRKKMSEDSEEANYHFVAFVPMEGSVWKLDGLERHPMDLGSFKDDWMNVARPMIVKRMKQYENDQIRFNLLSVCQSPLLAILKDLARNVVGLRAVEAQLDSMAVEWKEFVDAGEENVLRGPDNTNRLTQDVLETAQAAAAVLDLLSLQNLTLFDLMKVREELVISQRQLRALVAQEISAVEEDDNLARCRRHDYTPLIYSWVKMLAEKKVVEDLISKTV